MTQNSATPSRIAFVMAPGLFAGAEAVVLHGAQAARAAGLDVELWVLAESRAPQYAQDFVARAAALQLPTQTINLRGRLDRAAFSALRRLADVRQIKVIHAHGYKALMYVQTIVRRRRLLIATHHGVTAHTWLVRLYHQLEFFLLKRCDGVVAVSQVMRDMLIQRGVAAHRVHVQDNPLVLDVPARSAPADAAQKAVKLVAVGRLSPEKGLDTLLKALAASGDDTQLTIVGDGPERENLAAMTADLGLSLRVEFAGFQTDIRSYLQAADVYVLPSLREGLPLALIEATACGLPALVSAVGATADIVKTGRNGLLLPPADVSAWQRALQQISRDLPTWQAGAALQAPRIRDRYSLQTWARNLRRIYQQAESGFFA